MSVPSGFAPLTLDGEPFTVDGETLYVAAPQEFVFLIPYGAADPDPPTIDFLNPTISPRYISGTATPGATVQALIGGEPYATVMADSNGDWTFLFAGNPGPHSVEVRQLVNDVASEYTAPKVFVILPDVVPEPGRYSGGGVVEEKKPQPPEVRLLRTPFRRPAAWPSDKDR